MTLSKSKQTIDHLLDLYKMQSFCIQSEYKYFFHKQICKFMQIKCKVLLSIIIINEL